MKTGKKVLSLLLAALLAVSLLPVSVFADLTGGEKTIRKTCTTPEGVTLHYSYMLYADGTRDGRGVTLDKAENVPAEFTIPTETEDGPIISIGESAFQGQTGLTKVVFPSELGYVHESAFEGCTGLTSIVVLPNTAPAYYGANSIEFQRNAFRGCTSLRDLDFGDRGIFLYGSCFADCPSLRSIHFPANAGISDIYGNPFTNTPLQTITVDPANVLLRMQDGVLLLGYSDQGKRLICYPAGRQGTSYTIPEGVTSIGSNAFSACSLRELTIPGWVSYPDLSNSTSLTKLTLMEGVESLTSCADCTALTEVHLPKSLKATGWAKELNFKGCNSIQTVYYAGSKADADEILGYTQNKGKTNPLYNAQWIFAEGGGDVTPAPGVDTNPGDTSTAPANPVQGGRLPVSAIASAKKPAVSVASNATGPLTGQLKAALENIAVDSAVLEDLAMQYAKLDYKEISLSDAAAELERNGVDTSGKTVGIVVQPYLNLRVGSAYPDSILFHATLAFDLIGTTADLSKNEPLTSRNSCPVGETAEMWDRGSLTLSLTLPSEFTGFGSGAEVYRNDKLLPSTLKGRTLTFTTSSSFQGDIVITPVNSPSDSAAASIGSAMYPTLQAAVDAVKDGEYIDILTSAPLSATVSRKVKFSVRPGAQMVSDVKNVSIKAGSGYIVTSADQDGAYRSYEFDKMPDTPDKPVSEVRYTDVPAGHWAEDAVNWAVKENIVGDTGDNKFNPNTPCTREQIVTFLWRAAGCPEPESGSNPFSDVKTEDDCCKAVLWAVEKGITSGMTATTFAPDEIVTRAQAATFLYRTAGSPPYVDEGNSFTDVGENAWYAAAVQWAVSMGLTTGTSATTFSPAQNCTRAHIVTFLYRAR